MCLRTMRQLFEGIAVYVDQVGVPPVEAGESLKKVRREGRFQDSPMRRPSGQTRKQLVLVPLQGFKEVTNFRRIFLLVVAAAYCSFIKPPVDDGSVASAAVLGYLNSKKVYAKLMANVKTRFFRLANRKLLSSCANELNRFVDPAVPESTKLKLLSIRSLQDHSNGYFADTCALVVQALLNYTNGRSSSASNSYGFYPFGKPAGQSIANFKAIPFPWLAIAMTEMYTFVYKDKDKWPELLKKCAHPMTQLWPWPTFSRYINFITVFRSNRKAMFARYEEDGGKYSELKPKATVTKKKTRKKAAAVAAESTDEEEEEDSLDADFA